MFAPHNLILPVLPLLLLASCATDQDRGTVVGTAMADEAVAVVMNLPEEKGESFAIKSEPYYPLILMDADGNISHATRPLLHKNNLVKYHYQRIGCNSDTCKREWMTFTAIQYPKDSVLQQWAADVVGRFYFDATRDLDIKLNGQNSEMNDEGEMVLQNKGCSPYAGNLSDGEKAMFDYYQSRLWCIGKNRGEEHGPSGRYGCVLYRCWQSEKVASYFVAYSTDTQQRSEHYVVSFDRMSGRELGLADIIKDDYLAELNDLIVDAARHRHFTLKNSRNHDLAIDASEGDYSSRVAIDHVGFVETGLAVSTDALPFDQWAYASHVLIIPYEKVNDLLLDRYRR